MNLSQQLNSGLSVISIGSLHIQIVHEIHQNFGTQTSFDFFGLVNELKSKGQSFLKVSDNYYDDIEARFGLDFNFCNELKELNILYDEDENGSFLQVYTNLINNTFFFEIVQRINNYQGYGANNALFRIAAQKNMI